MTTSMYVLKVSYTYVLFVFLLMSVWLYVFVRVNFDVPNNVF